MVYLSSPHKKQFQGQKVKKKKKAISDKQVPTVAAGQVSVQVPGEITSTSKSSEEQKHCFGISRLWFGFSRGNPAWEKQSRRCLQLHFFFLLFASIDRNSKAEAERAACTVLLLLLQTAWEETLTTRIKTFYVGMEGGGVGFCRVQFQIGVTRSTFYIIFIKSKIGSRYSSHFLWDTHIKPRTTLEWLTLRRWTYMGPQKKLLCGINNKKQQH